MINGLLGGALLGLSFGLFGDRRYLPALVVFIIGALNVAVFVAGVLAR